MHRVIVLELYTKPVYKLFHIRIRLNIQSSSLRWELSASPDTYSFSNPPASHNRHAVCGKN